MEITALDRLSGARVSSGVASVIAAALPRPFSQAAADRQAVLALEAPQEIIRGITVPMRKDPFTSVSTIPVPSDLESGMRGEALPRFVGGT